MSSRRSLTGSSSGIDNLSGNQRGVGTLFGPAPVVLAVRAFLRVFGGVKRYFYVRNSCGKYPALHLTLPWSIVGLLNGCLGCARGLLRCAHRRRMNGSRHARHTGRGSSGLRSTCVFGGFLLRHIVTSLLFCIWYPRGTCFRRSLV